jgi:hypothetical protein
VIRSRALPLFLPTPSAATLAASAAPATSLPLALLAPGSITRTFNPILALTMAPPLLARVVADVVRTEIEEPLLLRGTQEVPDGDQMVCYAALLPVVGFDDGLDLLAQRLVAGIHVFEHGDQPASLVREFATKPLEVGGKLRIMFIDSGYLLSAQVEPLRQGRPNRNGR